MLPRKNNGNWKYRARFMLNDLDVHTVKSNNIIVFILKCYYWGKIKGWKEWF